MSRTYQLAFALLLGAMFATLYILMQKPWQAFGNVNSEAVMESTTTPAVADRTNLCPQGNNAASSTTGTLASVSITGYGTGELMLVDATTSIATARATAATSSLMLVHFPVMGTTTVPLNLKFKHGLFVDYTTGVGTSTITYRCGS